MTIEEIRFHISDKLTPAKGQRGFYICPLCGSGTGPKRTAAMRINADGVHAKCFSCNFYGDVFDLVSAMDGIDRSQAKIELMREYGVEPSSATFKPIKDNHPISLPRTDFSAYINLCVSRMPGSPAEKYLHDRGFTNETIKRFQLGYDPDLFFPDYSSMNAIVFPYNKSGTYYGARSIEGKYFYKPSKDKAGEEPLFNPAAISADVCFVVESQLDAITIEQCGSHAIAVGGTGSTRKLLSHKYGNTVLVLCFDNDSTGESATNRVATSLTEAGIRYIKYNISGNRKDPNELLQEAPDILIPESVKFIVA